MSAKRIKIARLRSRPCTGATIAELGAALMLMCPLMILICYVSVEVMQVCMLKSILDESASVAARRLAIAYGTDQVNAIANPNHIFSEIRFNNVVNDNRQFKIPPGAAGWNLYNDPPTVTVAVTFKGGQYGLPAFPSPDPLGLGNGFMLTSSSTANLE